MEDRLQSGQYATAEEVVAAGLGKLESEDVLEGLESGELSSLVRAGLESGRREGTVDAKDVYARIRANAGHAS